MPTEHDLTLLRERIVRLEDQVAFLYRHFGIASTPDTATGDDPRIVESLKRGNMIEAIKVYRELYSSATVTVSLEEAKRAVEEIKRRNHL
jgi:ribosomal protein L7/L12